MASAQINITIGGSVSCINLRTFGIFSYMIGVWRYTDCVCMLGGIRIRSGRNRIKWLRQLFCRLGIRISSLQWVIWLIGLFHSVTQKNRSMRASLPVGKLRFAGIKLSLQIRARFQHKIQTRHIISEEQRLQDIFIESVKVINHQTNWLFRSPITSGSVCSPSCSHLGPLK